MGFAASVKSALSNATNFHGRAARPEFWNWFLFVSIGWFVAGFLGYALGFGGIYGAGGLFFAVTLLPSLAVSIRRLHDIDRSGWWLLISIIPFAGGLLLLMWEAMPGTLGENSFGEDPLGRTRTRPILSNFE